MPEDTTPMITKTGLKSERGWTDKLITTFMPEPDLTKENPNYRRGPLMSLFKIDRVEKIEQTDEFKEKRKGAEKRKESAKKATETKRNQLSEWLNTVEIHIPSIEKTELISQACDHYNDIQMWRKMEGRDTCGKTATPKSDQKFLERICVNYLRHDLTRYEDHLDEMYGKVGFYDGYEEIRRKIFLKIAEVYPWLLEECKRQHGDELTQEQEN